MRQSQLSIPDYGALLSERGAHCVYLQWQLAGGSGGNRSVTVPGLSASWHLPRHSTFGWADSSTPPLRLYSLFFPFLSSFSLLWSPLGALQVLLEELSFAAVDLCPLTCVGWGQLALLGICWLRSRAPCDVHMHSDPCRRASVPKSPFQLVFANYCFPSSI